MGAAEITEWQRGKQESTIQIGDAFIVGTNGTRIETTAKKLTDETSLTTTGENTWEYRTICRLHGVWWAGSSSSSGKCLQL